MARLTTPKTHRRIKSKKKLRLHIRTNYSSHNMPYACTNIGSYIIRIKSVPVVILIETNEILNYSYVLVKKRETYFKLIKFDRADINLK